MFEVAFSRRMCCSRVASVRQNARFPRVSLVSPRFGRYLAHEFSLVDDRKGPAIPGEIAKIANSPRPMWITGRFEQIPAYGSAKMKTAMHRAGEHFSALRHPQNAKEIRRFDNYGAVCWRFSSRSSSVSIARISRTILQHRPPAALMLRISPAIPRDIPDARRDVGFFRPRSPIAIMAASAPR